MRILFYYNLDVYRSTQSIQIAMAIVLLVDNLKSIEFKHMSISWATIQAQLVCLLKTTKNFTMLTKLIPLHERMKIPMDSVMSFVNKSSALRRIGQENPIFVKFYINNPNYMIVPNRVWQFLVVQNLGGGLTGGYL